MTFSTKAFLASLLGYPLLDRLLSSHLFTHLPPSRSKIYRNRLLSCFHSLWTSSLCLYLSIKNYPPPSLSLSQHPLFPPQLLHQVISAEIGYLIQDALSVLSERHSSLSFDPLVDAILLHHSILAVLFSMYEGDAMLSGKARTEYYMACLLMMGASNILMHAGWLVERLAPKSFLMKVLRATTWPSFMFFRFMVFVWVYFIFARSKGGEFPWWKAPFQLRGECIAGSAAFIAFNGWLGWVLFVKSYLKKSKVH